MRKIAGTAGTGSWKSGQYQGVRSDLATRIRVGLTYTSKNWLEQGRQVGQMVPGEEDGEWNVNDVNRSACSLETVFARGADAWTRGDVESDWRRLDRGQRWSKTRDERTLFTVASADSTDQYLKDSIEQ